LAPVAKVQQLGLWLRGLRDAKGVPLRIVAAKAELDSTLLSKFERGERIPTDTQGIALADYFKVPRKEMHKQLVAARILREHGSDPTLRDAIAVVKEHAGSSRKYPRQSVSYSSQRRGRS
jgi:transcriptional regulator with XRE-family HTH domain